MLVSGTVDIPMQGYKLEKEKKRMTLGKKIDPNQRIDILKVIVHPGEVRRLISPWIHG